VAGISESEALRDEAAVFVTHSRRSAGGNLLASIEPDDVPHAGGAIQTREQHSCGFRAGAGGQGLNTQHHGLIRRLNSSILCARCCMTLKLSTLAIVLGLGMGLPQIFGIMNPKTFAERVRKFPRNVPIGIALMLLGTAWFLWNLNEEAISDFATFKPYMMAIFGAVGVGACIYVQDFLAVRGLAVVFLLLGKLMVDTGRPMLGVTHWTLVIQTWAYVLVIAGIWLTVSPWWLRDLLNWATANEQRVRIGSAIRLAFGLFVAVLGFTKF
jgi:hypothetical protein